MVVKAARGCWQRTGVELVFAMHMLAELLIMCVLYICCVHKPRVV